VFTARYALSPYIKQIRFVLKGLRASNRLVSPIPVAARSKTGVGGRSLAGGCGFESRRGH
jgi:hypothetical protein